MRYSSVNWLRWGSITAKTTSKVLHSQFWSGDRVCMVRHGVRCHSICVRLFSTRTEYLFKTHIQRKYCTVHVRVIQSVINLLELLENVCFALPCLALVATLGNIDQAIDYLINNPQR